MLDIIFLVLFLYAIVSSRIAYNCAKNKKHLSKLFQGKISALLVVNFFVVMVSIFTNFITELSRLNTIQQNPYSAFETIMSTFVITMGIISCGVTGYSLGQFLSLFETNKAISLDDKSVKTSFNEDILVKRKIKNN